VSLQEALHREHDTPAWIDEKFTYHTQIRQSCQTVMPVTERRRSHRKISKQSGNPGEKFFPKNLTFVDNQCIRKALNFLRMAAESPSGLPYNHSENMRASEALIIGAPAETGRRLWAGSEDRGLAEILIPGECPRQSVRLADAVDDSSAASNRGL
jgi:hypothetical protein